MDNFIPETSKDEQDVPYYEDVKAEGGWQGHGTGKSMQSLQSEITEAIGRLGGMVVGFQQGNFGKRQGFRINYTLQRPDGSMWPGELDVAALPVKDEHKRRKGLDTRREKSLKMALYMLRVALNGSWFLKQLSPGFNPLMPWMIMSSKDGKKYTISSAFQGMMAGENLLPEPEHDEEAVEGEFSETD